MRSGGTATRKITIVRKKKIIPAPKRPDIPDPSRMSGLSIYDGQIYCGCVHESWGIHYAFGPDHTLVGEFNTEGAAIRALPTSKVQP
jgi:hypothetical protein